MTEKNIALRNVLKEVESVIVSALRSQPEDDEACRRHLEKTRDAIQSILLHTAT